MHNTDKGGTGDRKQSDKSALNKTNNNYTYWGSCWKCSEFGHLAKECSNSPWNTNLFSSIRNQTTVNSLKKCEVVYKCCKPWVKITYPYQQFPPTIPTTFDPANHSGFPNMSRSMGSLSNQMTQTAETNRCTQKSLNNT